MYYPLFCLVSLIVAGTVAISGSTLFHPAGAQAAEDSKPAKKDKPATSEKKAAKPKAGTPKKGGSTAPSSFKDGAIKASGAEAVGKAQACYGDVPKIDSLSPDEGKAGETVKITGKNFGATGCLRSVSFGPGNAAKFEQVGQDQITATVPAHGRNGLAILTVTTASGEDSKPFLLK